MDDTKLQTKVRTLLDGNGKTQAMLAEYLDVSASHLSRVLRGERPAERLLLEEIAGFFDLSLADLVAGTEHEDVAVPGRGEVERETYEQLLDRLRAVMSRAESAEAALAAELTKSSRFEEQLAAAQRESDAAKNRSGELEAVCARFAVERVELRAQVDRLQGTVEEMAAVRRTLDGRVQQLEGEVLSGTQRARTLIQENERLRTMLAASEQKCASLTASLQSAHLSWSQAHDAWVQAEQQRQALAARLQNAPGAGALLFSGLIGLGAGVLAASPPEDSRR